MEVFLFGIMFTGFILLLFGPIIFVEYIGDQIRKYFDISLGSYLLICLSILGLTWGLIAAIIVYVFNTD